MAGKWNNWYKNLTNDDMGAFVYGDTITYQLGYDFLKDCDKVEDWGCGAGGFKRFFINKDSHKYTGIDGSETPFSNITADLTEYTSTTDGIFMRHVLEHNHKWEPILSNACKSFRKKMCLILFTPLGSETKQIFDNSVQGIDVPNMSFNINDLINIFKEHNITHQLTTFKTDTGYKMEHVFFLYKNDQLEV